MAKKIFTLILFFLFLQAAEAQTRYIRNDTPTTRYGNNLQVGPEASVDQYGRIQTVITGGSGGGTASVIPVSNATSLNGFANGPVQWIDTGSLTATGGTTTVITTASTSTLRVGDIVSGKTGTAANLNVWAPVTAIVANTSFTIANALPSAPANADTFEFFRPVPLVSAVGVGGTFRSAPFVQIDQNYQNSTTLGLLKLEDAASASGDAGVATLGIISAANPTTQSVTTGDYVMPLMGQYGNSYTTLMLDPNLGTAYSVIIPEDQGFPAAGPLMMSGGVNNRSFAAFNSTNGDATPFMTGDKGVMGAMLMYDSSLAGASSPVVPEDTAVGASQANILIAGQAQTTLTADTTTGNAVQFKGNTFGVQYVQPTGGATNGATTYSKISTADNNAASIKGSAGTVYSVQATSLNAAVRYVKLYNKATAPTCGTDTPVVRLAVPPSSAAGPALTFPVGAAFPLGIGICIVTGITDADNTATAASEQLVNITYN